MQFNDIVQRNFLLFVTFTVRRMRSCHKIVSDWKIATLTIVELSIIYLQ